jgi:hypothetical protein
MNLTDTVGPACKSLGLIAEGISNCDLQMVCNTISILQFVTKMIIIYLLTNQKHLSVRLDDDNETHLWRNEPKTIKAWVNSTML